MLLFRSFSRVLKINFKHRINSSPIIRFFSNSQDDNKIRKHFGFNSNKDYIKECTQTLEVIFSKWYFHNEYLGSNGKIG